MRERNPQAPPELDALILRLLSWDRADRPSSAAEVLSELQRLRDDGSASTKETAAPTASGRRTWTRPLIAIAASLAGIVLVVGISSWIGWPPPAREDPNVHGAGNDLPKKPKSNLDQGDNKNKRIDPVEALVFTQKLDSEVTSLAVAGKADKVVTGTSAGMVQLWNASTGNELAKTNHHESGKITRVRSVACTPDGAKVFVAPSDYLGFHAWENEFSKVRSLSTDNTAPDAVAVSLEGRHVAVKLSGALLVFDTTNLDLVRSYKGGASGPVAISRDGYRILAGSGKTVAGQEDPKKPAFFEQSFPADLTYLSATPDLGRFIVGWNKEPSAQVWDVTQNKKIQDLTGHRDGTVCVAISPDGRRALTGGRDTIIRLWNVVTGEQLAELKGHTDNVTCVAFAADGKHAFSGSRDKSLRKWRLSESAPAPKSAKPALTPIATIDPQKRVYDLAFTSDGKHLYTIGDAIRKWDLEGKLVGPEIPVGDRRFALSPDDKHALCWTLNNPKAILWQPLDGGKAQEGAESFAGAISRDGTRIYGSSRLGGVVGVYNVIGGKLNEPRGVKTSLTSEIREIAVHPKNKDHVLVGSEKGGIVVWDVAGEKLVRTVRAEATTWGLNVQSLDFSSTGSHIAYTIINKKAFHVYDVDRAANREFKRDSEVRGVAFVKDRWVVSCEHDRKLVLWDVKTGDAIAETELKQVPMRLAVAPSGDLIAVAGSSTSSTVEFFRVTRGPVETAASTLDALFAKHGKDVIAFPHDAEPVRVVVAPAGLHAAVGCSDGSVHLWDLVTGESTKAPGVSKAGIAGMAFLTDSKVLACNWDNDFLKNNGSIWDLGEKTFKARPAAPEQGGRQRRLVSASPLPGGKKLVVSRNTPMWTFVALEWSDGTQIGEFTYSPGSPVLPATAPSLSADGSRLLADHDRRWYVWDTEDPSRTWLDWSIRDRAKAGNIGILTSDGKQAVFATDASQVMVYDVSQKSTQKPTAVMPDTHGGEITCIAASAQGGLVLTGGKDGVIHLWDLAAMKRLTTLKGHEGAINHVAFTPDGRYALSVAADKTLRFWKLPR